MVDVTCHVRRGQRRGGESESECNESLAEVHGDQKVRGSGR